MTLGVRGEGGGERGGRHGQVKRETFYIHGETRAFARAYVDISL